MNARGPTVLVLLAMAAACLSAEPPPAIRQWRVAEFSFTARETYPDTPLGVRFGARFTGPDGSVYDVPGFWDGAQTWRVRFAPPVPGAWTYETSAVEDAARRVVQAFTGRVMHGREAAERVDVPLGDADELRLIVRDGGDGTNYDHADWADAELVKADGSSLFLDAIQPASARQGHGELAFRTNIPGQPLRIGERTFTQGLGTHAQSEICYPLDGTFARFRAWVGVDATVSEHGSVSFDVVLSRRATENVGRHDPGLHGQAGAFTALAATGASPLYRHGGILRASADGHSLSYADGTPFFWLGDTWWFCPSDLVPIDGSTNPAIPSAYRDLLHLRQRQGFTTIHMAFLGRIAGTNPYDDARHGPNLSPAYWQTVDRYLDEANASGLIPIIGMGWAGRPLAAADWRVLWRHVVARYGAHAVTWLVCGEYNVRGAGVELVSQTLALGQFIKDTDPYQRAMTIHPWAYSGDRRQAWEQSWYDIIMFQGGHGSLPPADLYRDAFARQPAKPVIEGECRYEGIHAFVDTDIREAAYRAIQSGACGFTYGSQGLWYPTQTAADERMKEWGTPRVWWEAARRPGAEQLGVLRRIYESVDWWRLRPAPDAVAVRPAAGAGDVEVIYDGVEHFPQANATNAHWSRLDEGDATCIALHPRGTERTALAYPPLTLPALGADERLFLVLAVGISAKANLSDPKFPADGVDFAVALDGETIWSTHRAEKPWLYQAIDLGAYAGQTVNLELVTRAGDAGNMNWDHALFRQPVIVRTGKDNPTPCREAYLAPAPRPLFAKADGDRTFFLYLPPDSGPAGRELRGVAAGTTYTGTWHDPRTGEALAPFSLQTQSTVVALPAAPDERDWVLVLRREQER